MTNIESSALKKDRQEWYILRDYNVITILYGVTGGKVRKEVRTYSATKTKSGIEIAKTRYDKAIKDKKNAGYVSVHETNEEPTSIIYPMLAHPYQKYKNKVTYPCICQPKYNGVRCIVKWEDTDVTFYSRTGKVFEHLKSTNLYKELLKWYDNNDRNTILDGELYIHGEALQTTVSIIKNPNSLKDTLTYVVYDIIDTILLQDKRVAFLTEKLSTGKYLKAAKVSVIKSEKELINQYKHYLSLNYEGMVVRKYDGKYENKRSTNLLKMKDFKDSEFKIVNFLLDAYKQGIFVCETEEGKEFKVVPMGTRAERQAIDASCIGKSLTVNYSDMSKDGIPIGNPVGTSIRDYE